MKLLSYPHTGTRWLRDLLWQNFGALDRAHPVATAFPNLWYTSHHTDELRKGLSVPAGEIVVTPLRDPFLACITNLMQGWGMPVSDWIVLYDVLKVKPSTAVTFNVDDDDDILAATLVLAIYVPARPELAWKPDEFIIPPPAGVSAPNKYKQHYLEKGTCPAHPKLQRDWDDLRRLPDEVLQWFSNELGDLPWMA